MFERCCCSAVATLYEAETLWDNMAYCTIIPEVHGENWLLSAGYYSKVNSKGCFMVLLLERVSNSYPQTLADRNIKAFILLVVNLVCIHDMMHNPSTRFSIPVIIPEAKHSLVQVSTNASSAGMEGRRRQNRTNIKTRT